MCDEKDCVSCGIRNIEAERVTWDKMKTDLMELTKETLAEMVSMWVKNYWTLQSYWMVITEREHGFDTAAKYDMEVWENLARVQGRRINKLLNLGNDTKALASTLVFTAPQWAPAGFDWRFTEITDKRIFMEVNKCPMGTYRDSLGLELIPCKLGADNLYRSLAKTINPNFEVTCVHAHPDPRIEGVMCQWEFILSD